MTVSTEEQTRNLLRASTIIEPDETRQSAIRAAASEIVDWNHLAAVAEEHNMAPLLHRHVGAFCDDSIEPVGRRLLGALAIRHRNANTTLTSVCEEVLHCLGEHNIGCIVLKGMALSHMIYPDFRLRPMRDIDLLVPKERAHEAQALLGTIGFSLAEDFEFGLDGGRYMRNHHHLPIASLERDGMTVSVELHTDALSGDYPESLSFAITRPEARNISIGSTTTLAMGHADMLNHLCRHAFEPAAEIRLGGITDIVSYADCYASDIDWSEIQRTRPYVSNALALLHYVSPLPRSLSSLTPSAPAPDQAGFGMRPLGTILGSSPSWPVRLQELGNPPPWWLHAYYGLGPDASITRLRLFNHLPRLGRWLFRRLRAAAGG